MSTNQDIECMKRNWTCYALKEPVVLEHSFMVGELPRSDPWTIASDGHVLVGVAGHFADKVVEKPLIISTASHIFDEPSVEISYRGLIDWCCAGRRGQTRRPGDPLVFRGFRSMPGEIAGVTIDRLRLLHILAEWFEHDDVQIGPAKLHSYKNEPSGIVIRQDSSEKRALLCALVVDENTPPVKRMIVWPDKKVRKTKLGGRFGRMEFPPCVQSIPGSELACLVPQNRWEREEFFLEQVKNGNVPDFFRSPISLLLEGPKKGQAAAILVAPDYLCLGTNEDHIYAQTNIITAQKIANLIGAVLPTRKLIDLIWHQAAVKLQPLPWGPPYDASMFSTERLLAQSGRINGTREVHPCLIKGQKNKNKDYVPGRLIAGHFKDYIIDPRLEKRTDRTCIAGWHQINGNPIQGTQIDAHERPYVDYSQAPRFVDNVVHFDDVSSRPFEDVLFDPVYHVLITTTPSKFCRIPV